jgi:hypothetical protein
LKKPHPTTKVQDKNSSSPGFSKDSIKTKNNNNKQQQTTIITDNSS